MCMSCGPTVFARFQFRTIFGYSVTSLECEDIKAMKDKWNLKHFVKILVTDILCHAKATKLFVITLIVSHRFLSVRERNELVQRWTYVVHSDGYLRMTDHSVLR